MNKGALKLRLHTRTGQPVTEITSLGVVPDVIVWRGRTFAARVCGGHDFYEVRVFTVPDLHEDNPR